MELKYKTSKFDTVTVADDNEEIIIEGWANPRTIDSIGDLMIPEGAKTERYKKNPIILYNHDRSMPVGKALEYKALKDGFWVKAKLAKSVVPQVKFVRDLVKEQILTMFSVGFNEIKALNKPDGTREITEWELHEISIVPLPMNEDAKFSLVKSLADKHNIKSDNIILKSLELRLKGETMEPEKKPKLDAEGKPMLDEQGNPIYEDEVKEDKVCKPKPEEKADADPLQECMSKKIPILIAEGKSQEQAVAIAMSMCKEEGKCSLVVEEKQASMIPSESVNIDATTPIEKDSPILEKLDSLIQINMRVASLLETLVQNSHNDVNEPEMSPMPMQDAQANEQIQKMALEKAGKLLENIDMKLKKLSL
jgi:HK97 family phage prohead protease